MIEKVSSGIQTVALMRAGGRVRDGRWIDGAPSHVMADLQRELAKDGYEIVRIVEPPTLEEGYADQGIQMSWTLAGALAAIALILAAAGVGIVAGELIAR